MTQETKARIAFAIVSPKVVLGATRLRADYSVADSAGRPQTGRQTGRHEQYLAWRDKGANHDVEVHYARSDPTISAISLKRMRREVRWLVILSLLGAGAFAGAIGPRHGVRTPV